MNSVAQNKVEATIAQLYHAARNDELKIMTGMAKSLFRPIQPKDFKHAFLAIAPEQGRDLVQLIRQNKLKHILEFGTSFGISTLFLAQGVSETGGHIITTELIASKARKAVENFKQAGVDDLIEVRVGDATVTLKGHNDPIDLLLLDGWKDLYLPVFRLLEPNFHAGTFIYVDNAEMAETRSFVKTIARDPKYHLQPTYGEKAVLITIQP